MPPCICTASAVVLTEGVGAGEGRQADGGVRVGRTLRQARGRVAGGRDGAFGLQQQVSGHVLDRLERADRAAELEAVLGIVDGEVQHSTRAAGLLARQPDERQVDRRVRGRPCRASEALARRAVEDDAPHAQGVIERGQGGDGDAGSLRVDLEHHQAVAILRQHEQHMGVLCMQHVVGGPVELVERRRHAHAVLGPGSSITRERHGRDRRPTGDPRQQAGLSLTHRPGPAATPPPPRRRPAAASTVAPRRPPP